MRDTRSFPDEPLELVARAMRFGERPAVQAGRHVFSYRELLDRSAGVSAELLGGEADLREARVAYLVSRSFTYPAVQWGIWRAGGLAVPMADSHPARELGFVLDDADPVAVVVDAAHRERVAPLVEERGIRLIDADAAVRSAKTTAAASLPRVDEGRRALMIYTSGTTGRPKGVVTTHANIRAQILSLVEAWGWTAEDHILLVLPLHHVHGVVNVLTCALWSGARCQMAPRFDPVDCWTRLAAGDLTLFMAVPTVYAQLVRAWEEAPEATRATWSEGAAALRLMVSGSAALPVRTLERWRGLTGHTLLERYGMTEIGMGLSNPLSGERIPGHVGQPLPGVEIRRVDESGHELTDPDVPGELQIRGPGVFREYWRRPEATAEAFDGSWFRTGDIAVVDNGAYRLLGRSSVDILKTGGYKVSALEIEEVLREHSTVRDCAVVGVEDEEWGQRIAAAVVATPGERADPVVLDAYARECLAPYKVPRSWKVVGDLPRNAMGKVVKPEVAALFTDHETSDA
jgi:malonyl-CoA/methylmalonyl-CoA synthetase